MEPPLLLEVVMLVETGSGYQVDLEEEEEGVVARVPHV
tara:strand:- start:217 stop:330 length:114 start_codon:yes stop_codon:yes gene_type:complete